MLRLARREDVERRALLLHSCSLLRRRLELPHLAVRRQEEASRRPVEAAAEARHRAEHRRKADMGEGAGLGAVVAAKARVLAAIPEVENAIKALEEGEHWAKTGVVPARRLLKMLREQGFRLTKAEGAALMKALKVQDLDDDLVSMEEVANVMFGM